MNRISSILITASIAAMLSACSSGGDSTPAAANTQAAAIGDITGSWSVTETVDGTACGDGINVQTYPLNVTAQSGSSITYTSNGNNFTGTLSGNKFTSSGSYPEKSGTATGSTTLTIDNTCSNFLGSATWSWTDGATSCSGTSQLSGIRNNSTGCGNVTSNLALSTYSVLLGLTGLENYTDKNDGNLPVAIVNYPYTNLGYSNAFQITFLFTDSGIDRNIDLFINGSTPGTYTCSFSGTNSSQTAIWYSSAGGNLYTGSGSDGSCTIVITEFSSTGRVMGTFDASVASGSGISGSNVNVDGSFDLRIK